jgi:urease accessory protein
MPWQARLSLNYRLEQGRSVLRHEHDGPLRILKSLYPEGDSVCHNVIVHPPGGLVGGDTLAVRVHVGEGAHALVSTPGATRFYASDRDMATQRVNIALDAGARLEWLPLEAIAYPGCLARNEWNATLAEEAEMIAWDVTALGLPNAGQPFSTGRFEQHLSIPGLWLEQTRLDATDTRLLDSPLGLGGLRCMGTLVFACGSAIGRERREALLAVVRELPGGGPEGLRIGVTCPNDRMLVVRALAPMVEPLMAGLQDVWRVLRPAAWGVPGVAPRIWRV